MAHHYHIELIDNDNISQYGTALPFDMARKDAQGIAEERGLPRLAGGVYGTGDGMSGDRIIIWPCDKAVDFDLEWDHYRNLTTKLLQPSPRDQPCASVIKKEFWCFLSSTPATNEPTNLQ